MAAIIVFCLSVLLATNVNLSNPPPNGESLSNTVNAMRQDSRTSYSTLRNDIFFSSFSSNVTNNYQDRHSVTTEKNSNANVMPITSDKSGFVQKFTSKKYHESTKSMTIQHITEGTKLQTEDESTTASPVSELKDLNTYQLSIRAQRPRRKKNYKFNSITKLNSTFINSAESFSNEHKYVKSISEQLQGEILNNTVNIIGESKEAEVYEVPTCTEVPYKIRSSVSPETTQSSTSSSNEIEREEHSTLEEKTFGNTHSGVENTEESQLTKPIKIQIFHGDSIDSDNYHSDKESSVRKSQKKTISRTDGNTREWDQSNPHVRKIVATVHDESRKLSEVSTNNSYSNEQFSIFLLKGNLGSKFIERTFNESIIGNISQHKSVSTDTDVSSDLRSSDGTTASAYDYINGRNVRHVSNEREGSSSAGRNSETISITPHPKIEDTLTIKNQKDAQSYRISSAVTDNVNNTDDSDKGSTAYKVYKIEKHVKGVDFHRNDNVEERLHTEEIKSLPVTLHDIPKHVENWTDATKSILGKGNGEFPLQNGTIINYSFTFNSYDVNPPMTTSTEMGENDVYTYNTTPGYNVELTSYAENYSDFYVNQTIGYSYNGENYLDSYLELVSVNGSEDHNTSRETTNESALHVNVSGWPVKLSAVVEGEIVLGGLMMVHERSDTVTCGPVMPQGGVQALETMLYTLDRLNAHPSLLPNVTLGAHILDDCDKDTYGLEMAVDFIKGRNITASLAFPKN